MQTDYKSKIKICFFGTYDRAFTSNRLILQGLKEAGIEVVEVNAEVKTTLMIKKQDIGWSALLNRVLRKWRIIGVVLSNLKKIGQCDVIYVGYPGHFDVLIAYPLAKLLGKKLVFNPLLIFYTGFSEEQGILSKKSLMGRLVKRGEAFIYNICDLIFADTILQKEFLAEMLGVKSAKMKVLPLGADDKYYAYTPNTNHAKKINVVYYGLYSPIHGVDYLIAAANILKKDKDIKFTFVGNGNTFERNYKRAKELKLENCEFFYNTPVSEHPAIIQKADIFVGFFEDHPSVKRVIANKMYQGLSLGRVVLTADSPVLRTVFKDWENMYFCKAADSKSIAKAIVDLKERPSLRHKIAKQGYELFVKEYTPKAVADKMVKLIGEIL